MSRLLTRFLRRGLVLSSIVPLLLSVPGASVLAQAPGAAPAAVPGTVGSAPPAGGVQLPGQVQTGTQNPTQNSNRPTDSRSNSSDQRSNDQRSNDQRSSDRNSNDRNTTENNRRDAAAPIIQDAPTEFQRLVIESIGQPLPIFGSNLFNGVPSTFAPVDDIPVTPDYVVGPGDELRIQVYGQVNQQGSFVVDRTGDIAFPGVGSLHVAGVRYSQLGAFLKSQLGRVYRNFDLNVNLGQLRSIQIFVTGYARRPGAYTVSSLSTLLNALFASGGALPQGSTRDIQLLRGKETVVHFDLYDLLLHGDKSKDVPLAPQDVIFIPPTGPQVAVAGSVNNPAIYEITPSTTVKDVIQLAGGETSVALDQTVRLERIFDHTMRQIVDVPLAQNPILAPGDILSVGAILNRYTDAVTLRGNVTTPGRYVWHPGMRILDLVPTRDQLITRDYFRRRNALGNTTADYAGQNPGAPASAQDSALQSAGALGVRGSAAPNDNPNANGGTSSSTKGGSSVGDALTSSNSVFAASTDVILSAPDLDWNYAVIERLDAEFLTTSLIPFNPGTLFLRNDQSQNLELKAGDVVTFFSTADIKVPSAQQTRYVRLEGEFIASGVYSVQPGETLRHLLQRAGGFTPDAYLFGSEFTRKSTQRVQQQRLNEYADSLEAQISAFSGINNARAINDRDVSATNAAAIEGRAAVARLRRVVLLGRIVLELKPDSRDISALPDLPLEDGDRFVIPRVPSTVNVEGQVYSANAFVFERGRRAQDYMRKAGGPDRDADRRRTFILRADGSVFSRQYGNVDHANIFPGDTIVIPPQLQHQALLRNLLDISSIVGQFGLGAAAINVLK